MQLGQNATAITGYVYSSQVERYIKFVCCRKREYNAVVIVLIVCYSYCCSAAESHLNTGLEPDGGETQLEHGVTALLTLKHVKLSLPCIFQVSL